MQSEQYRYEVLIRESHLDTFGHVNHAQYLTLFEEARWELVTNNGYGLEEVIATNVGGIVLEIHVKYRKELKLRERATITTQCVSLRKKIWTMRQEMFTESGDLAAGADVTMGLFDTLQRRLIAPSAKWLAALGVKIDSDPLSKL